MTQNHRPRHHDDMLRIPTNSEYKLQLLLNYQRKQGELSSVWKVFTVVSLSPV